MIMTLLLWLLLTLPTDRIVCSMWVSTPPTTADVRSACGTVTWPDGYLMQAVEISSGRVACVQPAAALPVLQCDVYPLGLYRLDVIEPNYQEWICTVRITHPGDPTTDEIRQQCPTAVTGKYILRYGGEQLPDPVPAPTCVMPALAVGPGLLDMPAVPADLATRQPYALLAGNLLWHGLAFPDCDGWSGLVPGTHNANECGLRSAAAPLLEWQNRWDVAIYQAAVETGVPPRLLKSVIGIESQWWPWATGPVGETSMIQVTDGALDLSLRYSLPLYRQFCTMALAPSRCERGYATLRPWEQEAIRLVLRNSITMPGGPHDAGWTADVTADMPTYARILAAHYCAAGEVAPSPSWENALILYHAGGACLSTRCTAGVEYAGKVMR